MGLFNASIHISSTMQHRNTGCRLLPILVNKMHAWGTHGIMVYRKSSRNGTDVSIATVCVKPIPPTREHHVLTSGLMAGQVRAHPIFSKCLFEEHFPLLSLVPMVMMLGITFLFLLLCKWLLKDWTQNHGTGWGRTIGTYSVLLLLDRPKNMTTHEPQQLDSILRNNGPPGFLSLSSLSPSPSFP